MGVKCILLYRLPQGAIPTAHDAERLIKALEAICAVPVDRGGQKVQHKAVEATCFFLKQQGRAIDPQVVTAPQMLRDVWLLQIAQVGGRCYLVQRQHRLLVEADGALRQLLERRLEYRPQPAQPVVVQGRRWRVGSPDAGDVGVKLLQVGTLNAAPMALGLEVEYGPLMHLKVAAPVLADIVAAIRQALGPVEGARLELVSPPWSEYDNSISSLPDTFGASHTALAYAELIATAMAVPT